MTDLYLKISTVLYHLVRPGNKHKICLLALMVGLVFWQNLAAQKGFLYQAVDKTINHGEFFTVVFSPKHLISFTATFQNSKVYLKWTIEDEKNLNHFIIEKGYDGKNFKDAAMVFANENTTDKAAYEFPDKIMPGSKKTIYYRLCLVYIDGKISYSPVYAVKTE